MTADVTREPTGGQGLREAAVEIIAGFPRAFRLWHSGNHAAWQEAERKADAVLALPELAALVADAERVQRVRKLVDFYDRHEYSSLNVDDLRRALDGDQ